VLTRRSRGLTPLRRRPKVLTTAPQVLEVAGSGAGLALVPSRRAKASHQGAAGADAGTDASQGALVTKWHTTEPDPQVRAYALAVAAGVSLPRAPRSVRARRGHGRLETVPFSGGSSDVDLDRVLERLVEGAVHRPEDVLVRERISRRRSVVLLVDVSGSMRGERVATAAATLAGAATQLRGDELAVVAFWSDAAVLLRLGAPVQPLRLVDALLRLPAEGLTNVALPLEVALGQLGRRTAVDARAVLLSDCLHNAGPDPRELARRLPRLDVLLDATGATDTELARDLARVGRGRLTTLRGPRDVPGALRRTFAA
jgi:Mg-chelatase subunit ChlD